MANISSAWEKTPFDSLNLMSCCRYTALTLVQGAPPHLHPCLSSHTVSIAVSARVDALLPPKQFWRLSITVHALQVWVLRVDGDTHYWYIIAVNHEIMIRPPEQRYFSGSMVILIIGTSSQLINNDKGIRTMLLQRNNNLNFEFGAIVEVWSAKVWTLFKNDNTGCFFFTLVNWLSAYKEKKEKNQLSHPVRPLPQIWFT